MKAKVCATRPAHAEFAIKAENMKASKKDTHFDNQEMQECFLKLKDLVPGLCHEQKMTKVQVLQAVIDYILELEITLDFDPLEAAKNLVQQQANQERKPLAENTHINTQMSSQHTAC
jgi:hypothetical protein